MSAEPCDHTREFFETAEGGNGEIYIEKRCRKCYAVLGRRQVVEEMIDDEVAEILYNRG